MSRQRILSAYSAGKTGWQSPDLCKKKHTATAATGPTDTERVADSQNERMGDRQIADSEIGRLTE